MLVVLAPVAGAPMFEPPVERSSLEHSDLFTCTYPRWWVLGEAAAFELTPSPALKKPLKSVTVKFWEYRQCKRPDSGAVIYDGYSTAKPGPYKADRNNKNRDHMGGFFMRTKPREPTPFIIFQTDAKFPKDAAAGPISFSVPVPHLLGQTCSDSVIGSRTWSISLHADGSDKGQATLHPITILPPIDPRVRNVVAALDANGRVFYQNHVTKTTAYDNPMAAPSDGTGLAPRLLLVTVKSSGAAGAKKKHYTIVSVSGSRRGFSEQSRSVRSGTTAEDTFQTVHEGPAPANAKQASVCVQLWQDKTLGAACVGTFAFSFALADVTSVQGGVVEAQGDLVPRKKKEAALGSVTVSIRAP